MNALLLTCILAALPGQNVDRAQAETDFRSANERALEGDLEGAIELYRTLIDRGIEDADVHYNLGNAYAQAGKPIDAIVSYERALRLRPGDAEVAANLNHVREKISGGKVDAPDESLTAADMIEPLVAPLSPTLFGWIAGAANTILFAAWWIRRRSTSKRVRRALTAAVGLALIALLFSLGIVGGHWVLARDPRGVVVEKTELREGPHAKFKSKGAALLGGRVRVLEEAEGFLRVLQQDGTTGWVDEKTVVRI